jgi:hypothetical protein
MEQPEWFTPEGSLGIYFPSKYLYILLHAGPSDNGSFVTYRILNGTLPSPLTLSTNGVLDGNPDLVANDTTSKFTVRATDNVGRIADRTFSMTVLGSLQPNFITPTGSILTIRDSVWVNYQLEYTDAIELSSVYVTLYAGKLPPGLQMNKLGVIRGYAKPPVNKFNQPIDMTYLFTVKLENDLGTTLQSFSITILNQTLQARDSRIPQILNTRPLTLDISPEDPYYGYYLKSSTIDPIKSGNYFNFKIIGHDFDNNTVEYEFINLPPGLTANKNTGWITGTPVLNIDGISQYDFSVRVKKKDRPIIVSEMYRFNIKITKNTSTRLDWVSSTYLGIIYNNTVSELSIVATASHPLKYRLLDGKLPPNLKLLENGELVGKVANEVNETLSKFGSISNFKFTVEAFSPNHPLLSGTREFTLAVKKYYEIPTETMYFKATPNFEDRAILNSLLTNTTLIPDEYLYRPEDIYFGKAKDVKFVQVYGIKSNTIEKYISAITQNHYWRNITLGGLKTAVAKDELGNVMYEVVYSEIVDNLSNDSGKSVAKEVTLPAVIDVSNGENIISRDDVFTSYEVDLNSGVNYYASLSSSVITTVYPASFSNMRKQIASVLEENYDSKLLPRWMTSQQNSGSILGFQQAWVICYTKPGYPIKSYDSDNKPVYYYDSNGNKLSYAGKIRYDIINNWGHKLNEIYFLIDRYTVDKSTTFDYNNYLVKPSWENLPSASPVSDPLDSNDFYVLFPRKTILSK